MRYTSKEQCHVAWQKDQIPALAIHMPVSPTPVEESDDVVTNHRPQAPKARILRLEQECNRAKTKKTDKLQTYQNFSFPAISSRLCNDTQWAQLLSSPQAWESCLVKTASSATTTRGAFSRLRLRDGFYRELICPRS